MNAALDGSVSRPAILGEMEFASGTVRLWSGMGDLVYDSNTYTGVGALLGVEFPEESSDGSSTGATFTLSGIDSSWNSLALTENYQGRDCTLYYLEFDSNWDIVADPIRFFKGVMDQMTIQDEGSTSVVSLSVERENYDSRAENSLYDDQEQKRRFPGDRGFEFLPAMQEINLHWGSGVTASGSPGGGTGGGTGGGNTPPNPYLPGGGPGRKGR